MGIPLQTNEYYELSGGMNDRDADTSLTDSEWSFLRNVEFNRDGSISTRPGCIRVNSTQINSGAQFLLDYYYELDDGSSDRLIVVGDSLYLYNNGSPTLIQSGFSTSNYWSAAQLSNRVILGNGIDDNYKWDGTNLYDLSIVAPVDIGLAAAVSAGGALTAGTYQYRYTYRNSTTLDESNPVNATASATTAGANLTITLTNFAVSADPQVDEIVIYRTTNGGVTFYEIGTKANTNAPFVDAGIADGVFELQEDNDIAPTSGIIAVFLGRLYLATNDYLYFSKSYIPGAVPTDNFYRIGRDGQDITCLLPIGNNALMIGKKRSVWILPNDPDSSLPENFNNQHGVLNHRSASVLDDNVMFVDQSLRPYMLTPTDLANTQRRVPYIGRRMATTFDSISASAKQHVKCQTITIEDRKQWIVSAPLESASASDSMIVLDLNMPYTEGMKEPGAWSVSTGLPAATLTIAPGTDGIPRLWRGDYNGFMWQHFSGTGDGATVNGTVTSATANTLTDTTQTWTVNQYAGIPVFIPEGTGENQRRTIVSNTADTLTITPNFTTTPVAGSTYAIGGIDFQAYTNWKKVTAHEMIKRLWFLWVNLSQIGNYTINVYLQFDFNTALVDAIPLILSTSNSIWGAFLWGSGIWGGYSSFQEKLQFNQYFHHIRIAYKNAYAGQPVVINGMGITVQSKELFVA